MTYDINILLISNGFVCQIRIQIFEVLAPVTAYTQITNLGCEHTCRYESFFERACMATNLSCNASETASARFDTFNFARILLT